jgi:hypothetical protein
VRSAVDDLFDQFRLAHAVELAAHGKTREADAVLRSNGLRSLGPGELDLLARIAVKENCFGEARSLWIEAVRLAPDNRIYMECLETLVEAERDLRLRKKIFLVSVATLFVVVAACLVWIFAMPHKSARHRAHAVGKPGQTLMVQPNSTNTSKPFSPSH